MRVYLVCVAGMWKYAGIARKLPDELEVLLVIVLSNALVFAVVRNAISLNTLLAISPRVVFLIKRLWCKCPSHQRVLIVSWIFDMFTRDQTTLAVRVANSWAVDFEAVSCALVHHGVNFLSLHIVLWAVLGSFPGCSGQVWVSWPLWASPGSSW